MIPLGEYTSARESRENASHVCGRLCAASNLWACLQRSGQVSFYSTGFNSTIVDMLVHEDPDFQAGFTYVG